MWFSRKQVAQSPPPSSASAAGKEQVTTKRLGDAAERAARDYLVRAGLKPIASNYRTPGRGGGEIDLIMGAPDGTLVFVEVRQRSGQSHGGAAASISAAKQQRIVLAARHYLMRFASPPPCRFDVVLVQGSPAQPGGVSLEWLRAAFDAS
ncbi:YraN family protein [Polaromonas sp.]|uniref:YraN family protein n=1 Tax=Polaromonas sp. TaxID=1869339 RepID=UPI002FC6604F